MSVPSVSVCMCVFYVALCVSSHNEHGFQSDAAVLASIHDPPLWLCAHMCASMCEHVLYRIMEFRVCDRVQCTEVPESTTSRHSLGFGNHDHDTKIPCVGLRSTPSRATRTLTHRLKHAAARGRCWLNRRGTSRIRPRQNQFAQIVRTLTHSHRLRTGICTCIHNTVNIHAVHTYIHT